MEEISQIKRFAKIHSVPIMKDEGIDFICNYIIEHNVKSILEIGTGIGYSSIRFAKTKDDVYNNVTSKLKPKRGNVVLMHDFSRNNKTLNALADIIDFGKQNGYVFRKITEDTPMVRHSVNN